jgi:hypothetical protein
LSHVLQPVCWLQDIKIVRRIMTQIHQISQLQKAVSDDVDVWKTIV